MTTRGQVSMRERLGTDYGWTPRQREVLDLLRSGRTNAQIAEALGISIQGVKWHITEILAKLHADSREEAADYWRRYHGLAPRFGRTFRGALMLGMAKWTVAAVGVVTLAAAAGFIVLAMSGGDEAPAAGTPTAEPLTELKQISLPEVRAARLSIVNHPSRETGPRPLDASRGDDLDIIEQLLTWLQAAAPSGLLVDGTPTGPPWLHLLVLLKDGTIVNASEAWDCTVSENSTNCVLAGPYVDVSLGEAPATRMLAPELAAWFHNSERDFVEMIPLEEADAEWAALTGRKP